MDLTVHSFSKQAQWEPKAVLNPLHFELRNTVRAYDCFRIHQIRIKINATN
jgi:hypothetical protein